MCVRVRSCVLDSGVRSCVLEGVVGVRWTLEVGVDVRSCALDFEVGVDERSCALDVRGVGDQGTHT